MNLHEYQAKALFRRYGVPVPDGLLITSPDEVGDVQARFPDGCVIKAQVHAGGRGKGGGVIVARDAAETAAAVKRLLGSRLVTPQTGPAGLPVDKLYAEPLADIDRELYLSLLVARAAERVAVVASAAGGMSIEEVAAATPERIHTEPVHPAAGLQPYQSRKLGFALGLSGAQLKAFHGILAGLYRLFLDNDASLVEINPLAVLADGTLQALDAKVNLDDNALYRQRELAALRDPSQEDPREAEAREHGLNYIHLDGDIGCMVNGAGLAMATMDLIKLEGGEPANFLDVGGGTTAERVAVAFRLILSDPKVRAVLVNIFGGIVRCDLIADGIIQAVGEVGVSVPVVVRLEGTNAEQGRQKLADSGLDLIPASGFAEAARRAVQAAREVAA